MISHQKKRQTRRRKRSKNLKMHILFISILSASELSEARIALPSPDVFKPCSQTFYRPDQAEVCRLT